MSSFQLFWSDMFGAKIKFLQDVSAKNSQIVSKVQETLSAFSLQKKSEWLQVKYFNKYTID